MILPTYTAMLDLQRITARPRRYTGLLGNGSRP